MEDLMGGPRRRQILGRTSPQVDCTAYAICAQEGRRTAGGEDVVAARPWPNSWPIGASLPRC
jgi:hypothetical protein